MARKVVSISTLGLILCLMVSGIVPPLHACRMACRAQPDMEGLQHLAETQHTAQTRGCCCGTGVTPCDIARGCTSDVPDVALFAFPRVENSTHTDIAVATTDVHPYHGFFRSPTNKVWTLSAGPPIPLFLLNLSLLC